MLMVSVRLACGAILVERGDLRRSFVRGRLGQQVQVQQGRCVSSTVDSQGVTGPRHCLQVRTMLALVDDKWEWNHHDGDWIFQGGPDSSGVLHDVYFNQWDELDSSPQVWAKPFQIDDPMETEPWQLAVNGIY